MMSLRIHHFPVLFALLTLGSCAAPTKVQPGDNGDISQIVGGWVSDTFTGRKNALLVRPDGKAEYTYSERKPGEDEDEVDDAVFDDRGGAVTWTVDLVYKGKNTWAAANAVQIKGPMPVPYPREPESEWVFDQSWRLENGFLFDVRSHNRYTNLRDWAQLSGGQH